METEKMKGQKDWRAPMAKMSGRTIRAGSARFMRARASRTIMRGQSAGSTGFVKGQASIDQLMASGVLLLAIAALLAFTFAFFSGSSEVSTAKSAVSALSRAVDFADAAGFGTNMTVQMRLPANVQSFAVSGASIRMRISTPGGASDIFENTRAALSGSLPNSSGLHTISVAALADGTVAVQEKLS